MNPNQEFRAAAVQDTPVWLQLQPSVEKACGLIAEAAAGGAQIIAFPESFLPGFPYWVFSSPLSQTSDWHFRLHENAVEVPSPATEQIGRAAAKAGAIVVIGVTERIEGMPGTLFNTNLVFGSNGEIIGRHRKLVPTWGERAVWTGGDGSTMECFPTPWGPLGTLCCGENVNSLARFALLAQGERIHVANFPSAALAGARHSSNELYLHVAPHAYEGKLYSIVASEFGSADVAAEMGIEYVVPEGSYNCISGIIGPNGEWVNKPLVDVQGIAYANCPLEPVIRGKLFHDVVGHYNRFDVMHVELDTTARVPLRKTDRG